MPAPKEMTQLLLDALQEARVAGFEEGERSQCAKAAPRFRMLAEELTRWSQKYAEELTRWAQTYDSYAAGNPKKGTPKLAPVDISRLSGQKARAIEWVKANPGSTSTEARKSGQIRGIGTLYKLASSGKIRRDGSRFFPLDKRAAQTDEIDG